MIKFMPGHRVKCTRDNGQGVPIGTEGTVDDHNSTAPYVIWDIEIPQWKRNKVAIHQDNMELVITIKSPYDIHWPMRVETRNKELMQIIDTKGGWFSCPYGDEHILTSEDYDSNLRRKGKDYSGYDIMKIIDPAGSTLWERKEVLTQDEPTECKQDNPVQMSELKQDIVALIDKLNGFIK